MHCCASSPAKEERLIPWTRDPSGRLQSQKKSEFRRTTDLPCHASTVQIGARSGKIGSSRIYRQLKRLQGRTLGVAVLITLDSRSDRVASACRLSGPVAKLQGARWPLRAMPLSDRFGSNAENLKASKCRPLFLECRRDRTAPGFPAVPN